MRTEHAAGPPEERVSRSVRINVLGVDLRLQTDDSDAFVQRVAEAVNQRGAALRQRGVPAQQAAVYAALQLAEELERLRDAHRALHHQAADQLEAFAEELVGHAHALQAREDAA